MNIGEHVSSGDIAPKKNTIHTGSHLSNSSILLATSPAARKEKAMKTDVYTDGFE